MLTSLLRLWSIVFFADMLGAISVVFFLAFTGLLSVEATKAAIAIGKHTNEVSFGNLFWKAVVAG